MKHIAIVILILCLTACGAQQDRVENVAANNMAADEVTEVLDESMPADTDGTIGPEGANDGGGNEANAARGSD